MKKSITEKELAKVLELLRAFQDKPVEDIELTAAELDYDVNIELDFDVSMDLPPLSAKPAPSLMTASAPAVPCHGTRKISIRVPTAVLNAFQAQAKRKGTRGQTLMNRALREASKSW